MAKINENLGRQLALLRQEWGLNQDEMAEKLGLPKRTYVSLELAEGKSFPQAATIKQLERMTGKTVAELTKDPAASAAGGAIPPVLLAELEAGPLPPDLVRAILNLVRGWRAASGEGVAPHVRRRPPGRRER